MTPETRARAERVRDVFGLMPRMRLLPGAKNPLDGSPMPTLVITVVGSLLVYAYEDEALNDPEGYASDRADLLPDPDDAGNLGLMLGEVRRRLGKPKLVVFDSDALCAAMEAARPA